MTVRTTFLQKKLSSQAFSSSVTEMICPRSCFKGENSSASSSLWEVCRTVRKSLNCYFKDLGLRSLRPEKSLVLMMNGEGWLLINIRRQTHSCNYFCEAHG